MELTPRSAIGVAFAAGVWALAAQFIFNRIIYFYIANSEYVAATIITLHLAGFWLGTLAARRWALQPVPLVGLTLFATVMANVVVWRLGATVVGLPLTVIFAAGSGLLLAALSGALIMTLMRRTATVGRGIVVADSAGSVCGAALGGFVLVPMFGLSIAFAALLLLQAATLAVVLWGQRLTFLRLSTYLAVLILGLAVAAAGVPLPQQPQVVAVDGLPIERTTTGVPRQVIMSTPSSYGLVTVLQDAAGHQELLIDNRPLCGVGALPLPEVSEWVVGATPLRLLAQQQQAIGSAWRTANVGLGCGITSAAILNGLPPQGRVDIVEINPQIVLAQRLFDSKLPHPLDDRRVQVHVADGFKYFSERQQGALYDAVVIDLAWMQNMNATHLFSQEMYQNIRRNLQPHGILAIWSEEGNPFSPVSLIIYRTLRAVFQQVVVDTQSGMVLFYASDGTHDLQQTLPPSMTAINGWVAEAAADAPINRLDNLVMNRYKFSLFGDSTWERLFEKYREM